MSVGGVTRVRAGQLTWFEQLVLTRQSCSFPGVGWVMNKGNIEMGRNSIEHLAQGARRIESKAVAQGHEAHNRLF